MRKRSLGLKMFRLSFSVFLTLAVSVLTMAQDAVTVTGKVTDSKTNQALPNVSVVGRNTSAGTSTDASGNFSIRVPGGTVLVFSNVNYVPQEATARAGQPVNISLVSEASAMEEVVVIGYGTRQKRDVTGAVSTVNSEEIEKSTSMTPELALQGRAAGVFIESGGGEPGARPTVRIRGVNTFGFSEPLYVVDGVPIYEGGQGITEGGLGDIRGNVNIFSLINPADIESISVLKDASAAAIYGVRASNGVILITTKRGGSGKPKVEFSGSYGTQNIARSMNTLTTPQHFELLREAYANNPDANTTFEEFYGPVYDANSPDYKGNNPTYNWQDQLKNKNAKLQDYSVRVSGGNDATTYYFSGGYSNTQSPLKGNKLERYSLSTNLDSRISKFITVGLNLRLVQAQANDNTAGSLDDMISTIPFQPFFDPSDPTGFAPTGTGTVIPNPAYDPSLVSSGAPYILENGYNLLWGEQTRYNVFAIQSLNRRSYELLNLLGNAYIQIEPITGLKIKGSLGGGRYYTYRTTFDNNDAWRFLQPPGSPSQVTQDPFAKGDLSHRNSSTHNLNKEVTINYNKTIAGDHNFDLILGGSEQFTRWYWDDIAGQVNFLDPQYWSVSNRPPNTRGTSTILQEDALIGYFGRLSYKFSDKYYVDATVRRDGSSRLAPGYKWDNFPSFAVAWRVSKENFFPTNTFINDLKIRGGWGRLGNFQSAGFYEYIAQVSGVPDYAFGSGNGNGVGNVSQAAAIRNFANKALTWEKVRTTSVAFDAMMFNNRLSFTAEYYRKETFDMIQAVLPPPNTGIEVASSLNVAQVRNSGIELQLGYNETFGEVNFNASANLTTVRNRVIKLNEGEPQGGNAGRVEEGYPLFYLWGYKVGGIFQTQQEVDAWAANYSDGNVSVDYQPGDMYFQDVYGNPTDPKERYSLTPDSIVNDNDRTYLGKTIPGYYYGFSFGANFRGFDMSVFFQGVGDVQRYNFDRQGLESMAGAANQYASTLNRWTPSNPSTTMPRAVRDDPTASTRFSSRFVENASYLRLKNLQIGYTIPASALAKLPFMQSFRVYLSGVNLLTITDYSGLDPENSFVPPTRQLLVGINASF